MVVESKIIVDQNTDVNKVMDLVEGLIGEDGDETGEDLKITYWNGKDGSAPAEGEAAIAAMQNDLDEEDEADEEDDEEVMEMVRKSRSISTFYIIIN